MHWLAEQIREIDAMAEQHLRLQAEQGNSATAVRAREGLLRALTRLAEQVAGKPGVLASFVAHDGLLLARGGHTADFDALAALGEQCMRTCTEASRTLSLGQARQVVIVGAERKLALVPIGQMVLGIVGAEATRLAESLER
ncbi:MAG: roadblock/LC7 domain-containing protein [Polyangiaceae bacterium]|nr:roadblock/LC7 domain-containing protein [Polyangiaceae bacterium]